VREINEQTILSKGESNHIASVFRWKDGFRYHKRLTVTWSN